MPAHREACLDSIYKTGAGAGIRAVGCLGRRLFWRLGHRVRHAVSDAPPLGRLADRAIHMGAGKRCREWPAYGGLRLVMIGPKGRNSVLGWLSIKPRVRRRRGSKRGDMRYFAAITGEYHERQYEYGTAGGEGSAECGNVWCLYRQNKCTLAIGGGDDDGINTQVAFNN